MKKRKKNLEVEETKEEKKLTKILKKKVSTIEVEENIEEERNLDNYKETVNGDTFIEVKDKIFTIASHEIKEKILYEKRIFIKERHQPKAYPKIINYRCKNQRKNEHILGANFCNALLKRKNDKKKCYYILEKEHSKECIELNKKNYINHINVIGNYNEFINNCINYLDSTEEYNKKELIMKLLEIYNNNKYNFKLKENVLKNIIGKWKSFSLRFTK